MLSRYVDIRSHLSKVGTTDMDDFLLSFEDDKKIDSLKANVMTFNSITFALHSATLSTAHTFAYIGTVAAMFSELPYRIAPTASIVNYVGIRSAISKVQKKSSSEPNIEVRDSVLCLTAKVSTTHEAEISSPLLAEITVRKLRANYNHCAEYM